MKFKAKIICTIKPTHPCYAGLDEKYRGKQKFDFKDTYTFNDDINSRT